MPTNLSLNKVRVTRLFGTEATVGLTDPKVHMQVKRGIDTRWIKTLDSGNFQVGLAMSSGGGVVAKAYPHELACSTGVADYFGWPAGAGSYKFTHNSTHSVGTETLGSGTYHDGVGTPNRFAI